MLCTNDTSWHGLAAQKQPTAGLDASHFTAHVHPLLSRRPMVHAVAQRGTFARRGTAAASMDIGT